MMTERKVRRLSADRGWVVHSAHRGKHWRVLASYAGGRAMPFTLASSPSDWRARKNFIAFLRRAARARATSPV
jgi:hypothetical protein